MSEHASQASDSAKFGLISEANHQSTPIETSIKVGRDETCDLVVASGKASRVHAIVCVDADALWVEDQKSTNGTFVNGNRIDSRTRLENEDQVRFGDQAFTVFAPVAQPDPGATIVGGMETIVGGMETIIQAASRKPAEPAAKEPAAKPHVAAEKPPAAAKAPEPAREPPAARSTRGAGSGSDAIPASWADSNQLEESSHTVFAVRKPGGGDDTKTPKLDPVAAIRNAREIVPADDAILVGLTKPLRGKHIVLGQPKDTQKWEMGRGEAEDIRLDDDSVSGRHAQLIHEQGHWKIVNLMSVNGTFVNDRKVLSAFLNPGDCIRMGKVELVFDIKGKGAKTAATVTPEIVEPVVARPSGSGASASGGWLRVLLNRLFGRR